MKNYEVIVIGCGGIGSAVLAPHAYEAELWTYGSSSRPAGGKAAPRRK